MGNLTKVRGKQLTFDSLRLTSFCVKCQLLRNVFFVEPFLIAFHMFWFYSNQNCLSLDHRIAKDLRAQSDMMLADLQRVNFPF